jgi:hypothetical protein
MLATELSVSVIRSVGYIVEHFLDPEAQKAKRPLRRVA